MIQTVLGEIKKDQLGFCHSHEHIFLAAGTPAKVNPSLRIDDFSLSFNELLLFKEKGGCSIVDAQPLGCGRMERFLVNASLKSGVNIIASTGFHKLRFYPEDHWIFLFSQDQLVSVFKNELTLGMYTDTDTKIPSTQINNRAGLIKTAIDNDRLNDNEKKWFYAAAEVAVETGYSIMCHTESGYQAQVLSDFYLNNGVKPNQLIICHLDRTLENIQVHRELAERGVYLEYDTIGRFKYHNDEEEAKLILKMIEWGFENNILLGLDTTRERLKSYGGFIGLDYIQCNFIPLLLNTGVTMRSIEKMMISNPAEAFSRKE